VLAVNAGVYEFGTLGEITEEHFDKTFNTNVRGPLFGVQKALPLPTKGSSVILTGSIASIEFFDFQNTRRSLSETASADLAGRLYAGGAAPCGPLWRRFHRARGVCDRYVAELKKENRPTDHIRFASGFWCLIVSDDPEKTFPEAADHIIYQANNYSAWLSAAGLQPVAVHLGDREQLRQSGLLKVVDPDTAIRMIRDFIDIVPITHFYSWTLPPGLPPRWAQTHLELFASKVIPAFS
jgi:hypothetical protein